MDELRAHRLREEAFSAVTRENALRVFPALRARLRSTQAPEVGPP
jgi:hypothetical protein